MQGPQPSEPKRLHPAAIPVWMLEGLGRFGIGLIPVLLFGGEQRLILLAFVAVSLGAPVVRYLRFRYRLSESELIVEGGLLQRWRRAIPLARVQSVDVVEKLRHRAFNVVELRVEAVGGSGSEAQLVALARPEADALRRALLEREPVEHKPREEQPPLVRLGWRQLVLGGITGGRVAVIAVLIGYLQEALPEEVIGSLAERAVEGDSPGLVVIAAALVSFVLLSLIISVVATVLVYWGFTVRRADERLVIERGLLERRRSTVPLRRVQAVILHENLLRRALGLAGLTVVVAGYAGGREEREETSMLLPIAARAEALDLAAHVLGARLDPGARLIPAPVRALWRRVVPALVTALAAAVAGASTLGPRGLLLAVLPLVVAGLAVPGWRALGHALVDDHVVVRSGTLVRRTTIVPIANVQDLRLRASPLQRATGLATVAFRIPKAQPSAIDLDARQAERRFGEVAAAMLA